MTDEKLLIVRRDILVNIGIPELKKKGFVGVPFSSSWFGRNNLGDFTYELGRLKPNSILELLTVHINKGDRWIKVYLNIFQLAPDIHFIEQLNEYDSIKYHIPPNNLTEMRLRMDNYKGPPIFHMLFCPEHKLGKSRSKFGFEKKVQKLSKILKDDFLNIDLFVQKWHKIQKANMIDWR